MTFFRKSMLAAGAAAVLATSSTPAFAAYSNKDITTQQAGDLLSQSYNGHRRHWRHRDRVDAGDILTGIGILAGIAIIAGAASDADKNDRNNDRYEPRYDDRDTDQPQPDNGPGTGSDDDLGSAVSICTDAAERAAGNGERVNEIRSVTRDGSGWRVEGELASDGFTCATANGRVDYIRLDERKI
jgi:hypothetical protein